KPLSPDTEGHMRSSRRPRLEILEERLPPGDWLLGAMLGAPLPGPSVFLRARGPAESDAGLSAGLPADHRATGPGKWSVLLGGSCPSLTAPPAPLPFRAEPGEFQSRSAAAGHAQFPVDNSGDAPLTPLGVDDLFASPFADPLRASSATGGGSKAG